MQILIYVLTMLMLMAILVYVRLENYRSFSIVKTHLEGLMGKNEREFFNLRAIAWYNDIIVSEKKNNEPTRKVAAASKLSLYPLLEKDPKKDLRKSQYELYSQLRRTVKSLIELLYKDSKFYKELQEKRPNFVDEILDKIEQTTKQLPSGIKTPSDLASLDLGDAQLNTAFTKILKGKRRDDSNKEAIENMPSTIAKEDYEESEVDDGYLSLLDFITVGTPVKLRVFLAKKQVLLAISGNQLLVEELLQRRRQLFSQVDAKPPQLSLEAASKQFKDLFEKRLSSIITDVLLDYSVTKTDPKPYE